MILVKRKISQVRSDVTSSVRRVAVELRAIVRSAIARFRNGQSGAPRSSIRSSDSRNTLQKRILVSRSADQRLKFARCWIREKAPTDEVLVLGATHSAVDDLVRSVCPPGGGLLGVYRMTLRQLALDLAIPRMTVDDKIPITGLGLIAVGTRVTRRCTEANALDYLAPVADSPRFPVALSATLGELRLNGVRTTELGECGPAGEDLSRLMNFYDEELEQQRLVDESALLEIATSEIVRGQHRLLGLPLVLLDLSLETAREARLLRALAKASSEVLALLPAGDAQGRTLTEEAIGAQASELEQHLRSEKGAAEAQDRSYRTKLDRVRRELFESLAQPIEAEQGERALDEADDSVVIFSAPGQGRECVEICRRIRDLALEGTRFDEIAILVRDPTAYLGLLEETLERAGIPAYFTRGTLRPDPAGRAFLALLLCAEEGLPATRMAEYLSLGQVPEQDQAGAAPARHTTWREPADDELRVKAALLAGAEQAGPDDGSGESEGSGSIAAPRRWERLLVDASVVGGYERWRSRLEGLLEEVEIQIDMAAHEDEPSAETLRQRQDHLRGLIKFVLPVIELLAALPERALWSEWLETLEGLSTATLRNPNRVLRTLAELRPIGEVGPVGLGEVRWVLSSRLVALRNRRPRRRYGKVFVGTIEEVRGRSFGTAFVPGLAEGIFPRRAIEDPLLLDDQRKQIANGRPLTTRGIRLDRERLLLRLAAGAARERLVVSYPNLDPLNGRSRVPSFYVMDILRASRGHVPDIKELEAAAGADTRVGWPAPSEPGQAIDDAEYDLAFLEPLLRLPPEETTGRGRFLIEANERLGRSLRSRWARWRPGFSWADGIVNPDAPTLAALDAHRLRSRSYSPTALEHFAACPYRFLLQAIHRLRPREEIVRIERLDPLTRGSLFHEVQFRLLGALRDRDLLPFEAANRSILLDVADETLDEVTAEYMERLAPAIPGVWNGEVEDIRIDLRLWVQDVIDAADGWLPTYFEFAFGLPQSTKWDEGSRLNEAVVLDGFRLRGSIDLVETRNGELLRATDHKTGRSVVEDGFVVNGGETLQPALYALAAECHLGHACESGRLYYSTRRGNLEKRDVALSSKVRDRVQAVMEYIDSAIEKGFLPAAPRPEVPRKKVQACEYCDYRTVCGPYEERRARIKPAVKDLERIRGWR